MTLHVMLLQDVHYSYIFGEGFKLQRLKNQMLVHTAHALLVSCVQAEIYFISTSGSRPPFLISHSPWLRPVLTFVSRWNFVAIMSVLGMTLNCINIFIVTGSFLYWYVMRPVSQRFFIHSCIYLRILIISYLATFLGTYSLSVLMCRKVVNQ